MKPVPKPSSIYAFSTSNSNNNNNKRDREAICTQLAACFAWCIQGKYIRYRHGPAWKGPFASRMEVTGYRKAFVIAVIFQRTMHETKTERERKGEARLRMITREGRAIRYRKCTLCRLRNSRLAHISIQIAIRAGPYLAAIPLNRLPRSRCNLAPSFFSPRNFLLLVFSLPLVARTSLVFLVFWTFLGARRDSFFVSSKILD